MGPGDIIRVTDWPGTRGRRFRVIEVSEQRVDAWDERSGRRSFPRTNCHVDRKATAARRERGG